MTRSLLDDQGMDPLRILAEANGFFTRAEAHAAGYDDNAIRRAVRNRLWTRVRQGAYTFSDLWRPSDPVARHLTMAHAVARRLGDRVALSHITAALEHGLLVWDADLSRVHVTRLDGGAGREEAGVVHHEALSLDEDLTRKGDHLVTKPDRAAVESASILSSEASVVVLDSGLHRKFFDTSAMLARFEIMQHWPGALHLEFAVRFADGRAESVGESRTRYLCYAHRLPAPELQFEVYDERRKLAGIAEHGVA